MLAAAISRGLLPELRRHHPLQFLRQPVLKAAGTRLFDTNEAPRVRWFETATVVLNRLEAYLLAPVVALCMLDQSWSAVVARWSPWSVGATLGGHGVGRATLTSRAAFLSVARGPGRMAGLVACVAAGKLLREAFTDHVTLPWAVFFALLLANVDLGALSHGVLVDCFWATVVVLKVRCRRRA